MLPCISTHALRTGDMIRSEASLISDKEVTPTTDIFLLQLLHCSIPERNQVSYTLVPSRALPCIWEGISLFRE